MGVRLEDGETIKARCVASNCEPKRTFLDLVDEAELDASFRADISQWQTETASLRVNFALSALPDFSCLPGKEQAAQHEGFIGIKPSPDACNRAYLQAKAGEWSDEPIMSITIPTTHDDSLAPPGHHVMNAHCQHFPYSLSDGRSWDEHRNDVQELIIDQLTKYAPNFRNSVVGCKTLTPLDLEREYGLTGGDVYHGKIRLDQLFFMRPHPSCSGYRTPIKSLYLCGSGTHPGGGVSGMPGHNAAAVIRRDL